MSKSDWMDLCDEIIGWGAMLFVMISLGVNGCDAHSVGTDRGIILIALTAVAITFVGTVAWAAFGRRPPSVDDRRWTEGDDK
jgi:hypothetical protein